MPVQPAFIPPASCLERAQDVPDPTADLLAYAETLILQYSDLAVLREQCRSALIEID